MPCVLRMHQLKRTRSDAHTGRSWGWCPSAVVCAATFPVRFGRSCQLSVLDYHLRPSRETNHELRAPSALCIPTRALHNPLTVPDLQGLLLTPFSSDSACYDQLLRRKSPEVTFSGLHSQ